MGHDPIEIMCVPGADPMLRKSMCFLFGEHRSPPCGHERLASTRKPLPPASTTRGRLALTRVAPSAALGPRHLPEYDDHVLEPLPLGPGRQRDGGAGPRRELTTRRTAQPSTFVAGSLI